MANPSFDSGEFFIGRGEIGVGLLQHTALRLNITVDSVENDDIDDPGALISTVNKRISCM